MHINKRAKQIINMSRLYTKTTQQILAASIDEVWAFISSPQNLKNITPPEMGFDILTELPDKMYAGLVIAYNVSPLTGFKTTWVTEITHLEHQHYFIDEQRFGPYTFWHHAHFIKPVEQGVLMTDVVNYKIPLGFIGDWANHLFIKQKLNNIFEYRRLKLDSLFNQN
jgi:ligand-binding SRPBCC domain-containing protein